MGFGEKISERGQEALRTNQPQRVLLWKNVFSWMKTYFLPGKPWFTMETTLAIHHQKADFLTAGSAKHSYSPATPHEFTTDEPPAGAPDRGPRVPRPRGDMPWQTANASVRARWLGSCIDSACATTEHGVKQARLRRVQRMVVGAGWLVRNTIATIMGVKSNR